MLKIKNDGRLAVDNPTFYNCHRPL